MILFFLAIDTFCKEVKQRDFRLRFSSFDILFAIIIIFLLVNIFSHDEVPNYYAYLACSFLVVFFKFRNDALSQVGTTLFVFGAFFSITFSLIRIENIYIDEYLGAEINSGEHANYIASTIPFLLSICLNLKEKKEIWPRILFSMCILGIGLGLFQIFATNTRTAVVAIFVAFMFIATDTERVKKLQVGQFFNGGNRYLYGPLLLLLVSLAAVKLYSLDVNSVIGRVTIWRICLTMGKFSAWQGTGLASFKNLYNNLQAKFNELEHPSISVQLLENDTFAAFNEYLQTGIELGPIVYIFYGVIFVQLYKSIRSNEGDWILRGAQSSIIAFFICSLVSYPMRTTSILINLTFYCAVISSRQPAKLTFDIRCRRFVCTMITTAFVLLACVIFNREFKRASALLEWEKAAKISLRNDFAHARPIYQKCYGELRNNGNFLFNYGSEMFLAGESKESLALLILASKQISHSNLYIYLGKSYAALGDHQNAELSFRHACNIKPNMFLPKFLLLQLYVEQKHHEKAWSQAKVIVDFPVKIPSEQVDHYKDAAKNYLITESLDI
ncbi:O-antigen ligase family protein [Dyadobacter sp. CY261]|nr:O-antigen ligase family protein [Dyadobacter sp. CY261]